MVEVGIWLPDFGFFECNIVDTPDRDKNTHCAPSELSALNDFTKLYIQNAVEAAAIVYNDDVYELREMLDEMKIAVKAESIAAWTTTQRAKVRSYVVAYAAAQKLIKEGLSALSITVPPKPQELP